MTARASWRRRIGTVAHGCTVPLTPGAATAELVMPPQTASERTVRPTSQPDAEAPGPDPICDEVTPPQTASECRVLPTSQPDAGPVAPIRTGRPGRCA